MNHSEFMIEQRKFLVETFEQARLYLNVILIAGYAGLFALWTSFGDRISNLALLTSGVLACVSLMLFLAWEIYSMAKRQQIAGMLRMAVDNPDRFYKSFSKVQDRMKATMANLERSWWRVVFFSSLTAALAFLIILSSLASNLMAIVGPNLNSQEIAVLVNTMWVAVGIGAGAVLIVLMVRIEAWFGRRRHRANFANALSAELDTSQELFQSLAETWQSDSLVDSMTLQELAYSRLTFDNNRDALHILDMPELQARLNEYYRKSFALLSKLQNDANYHLALLRDRSFVKPPLDGELELQRIESEIASRLEKLSELSSDAKELSQKLQSHI